MSKQIEKIKEITDEEWQSVNKENRLKVEEYLRESVQLSDETLKQYTSALKIFFFWIKENAGDKHFTEIKPRDFLLYQNYLIRRGLSSSAIRLKRSAVSSFNSYVETYYIEEYPSFRSYITKKIPVPTQAFVNEKEPLTLDEYARLCEELEKREMWQQLAYLKFSFSTGCRRAEVRQLLKDVVNYEPKITAVKTKDEDGNPIIKESRSYLTHTIRCKGKGKQGKPRQLQFDQEAMDAIKKWLVVRGEDDCPYVFVTKNKSEVKQVSNEVFNLWCDKYFEPIVGRRVHPHIWRESRATSIVIEQGKDIIVAQKLLGHNDSSTTQLYVIRDDEDASDEAFV